MNRSAFYRESSLLRAAELAEMPDRDAWELDADQATPEEDPRLEVVMVGAIAVVLARGVFAAVALVFDPIPGRSPDYEVEWVPFVGDPALTPETAARARAAAAPSPTAMPSPTTPAAKAEAVERIKSRSAWECTVCRRRGHTKRWCPERRSTNVRVGRESASYAAAVLRGLLRNGGVAQPDRARQALADLEAAAGKEGP